MSFTFGAAASPFGSTPAQSSTSVFGLSQPTTAATTFGLGTSTTPAFGLGSSAPTSSFFSTTTTQPAQTSLFGAPATQPAQTSLFGAPASQPAQTSLFGAPASQPAQTSLFGAPTSLTSAFGTSTQANVTPLISSQPQTSSFFSGLGTKAGQTSLFGTTTNTTGFAAPAQQQTSSLFGSLQKPPQTTNLFGSVQPNFLTQQQQQLQAQIDPNHAFYQSIFQCHKFGDERDTILANFNYLQACLGTGKGYYSQTLPPVIYTTANPFYRCKAVGYEFVYTNNNEDGQVSFDMKKSHDKIRAEETQFITALQQMLGRPSIFFKISGIKATSEEQCLVNIYAEDQTTLRRVPATDLANAFLQPNYKPQLDTWGVTSISAKVRPSPEQLRRYLENAPEGIDPRVWQQAQKDNPDPENMIPTPIVGIDALKKRVAMQQSESEHHAARLSLIEEECAQYQQRTSSISTEITQMKRKQGQLTHRLLAVVVHQEIMRKSGTAMSAEEEDLERRLDYLTEQMNSPTEFKGRLRELLSQMRLHQYTGPTVKYTIDEASLHQIRDFLETQQSGLKYLVQTVKADLQTLNEISDTVSNSNFENKEP